MAQSKLRAVETRSPRSPEREKLAEEIGKHREALTMLTQTEQAR